MRISIIGCTDSYYHDAVRIAHAFARKGHTVKAFSLNDAPFATINDINEFSPDFCLVTIGRDYDIEALKKLKDKTFLVHWAYDEYTPRKDSLYERTKNIYDLTFVKAKGLIPLLKEYCNRVVWMPMYYDNHFDGYIKSGEYSKIYDIVFVGEPHPVQSTIREKYLAELVNDGYNVSIIGYYWDDHNSRINANLLGGAVCTDLTVLLARSKIAVNFENDLLEPLELGFSDRILKVMGAGCFCLTHNIVGLNQLFENGKDLIVYESYTDLKAKLDYYLNNTSEREKIAQQGQTKVLSYYNIDKVTDRYIEEIRKYIQC